LALIPANGEKTGSNRPSLHPTVLSSVIPTLETAYESRKEAKGKRTKQYKTKWHLSI